MLIYLARISLDSHFKAANAMHARTQGILSHIQGMEYVFPPPI